MLSRLLRAFVIAALVLPDLALAYGDGGGVGYVPKSATPAPAARANPATTKAVVNMLTGGVRGCQQRLPAAYRYDCYSQVYGQATALLAGQPAFNQARVILQDVERSLNRTVRRNLDRAAPQVRAGNQQFRAIRADTLPAAKAAFADALEQAETKLLRSASVGEHHVRIAAALNSNKVLLRSALLLLRFII
ncbi:MAG: hypothetical protein KDK24_14930 [Pseudooceanicola sp.]|nr:hypothetical protein [Pseudooceanicola sp.]